MLVQPLRSMERRRGAPLSVGSEAHRVAVLLNANARRVDERVLRSLRHVVPEEDLFLSRSPLDCRRHMQAVLERGYPMLFTGGGDGTFMGVVNELFRQVEPRGRFAGQRLPRLGVLKLGTGNGLASYVNASGAWGDGILDDVVRARSGEVPGSRRLELLEVDGQRTPFAGLGVDGKVLNDFLWVKNTLGRGPLKHVLSGKGGYFSAVALRTVPYYLLNSAQAECEVFNGPTAEAWRLGADGKPVGGPIAPGGLLYRGLVKMAAAATVPFYGYGFKMFPFAGQERGYMQLRLGDMSTTKVLANLPRMWAGRWFPEGLMDFYVQHVTLRFARPMPLQVGGDAAGYRDTVTFSMAPESVELLDFNGAVH